MRRDRRNELGEEHVSARPIRYLAAIALWTLPNHAGAQCPSTAAPEVLRVTRTADDGGGGVAPAPGSLAKICPDGAPNCQAPPNGGLAGPTLERVRKHAGELTVQGELRGKPLSRFTVEVFGNRAAGSGEGEMFLGEVASTSDAEGLGKFSLTVDASKLAAMPASFTATVTSADGATSEFSQPVTLSE